jgi:hypothetical protein
MAERQVKTGVYNGAAGEYAARSLAQINYLITTQEILFPPIPSVDFLVAAQVKIAIAQGRHSITVLDLGSGEGNLMRDIISRPEFMEQTQVALREARTAGITDFNINIIGLTDTEKLANPPSINGTVYAAPEVPFASEINYPTTATNYAYAITNSQPLSQFLAEHAPQGINLIIVSESMKYLPRHIFAQTLEDIASGLALGGRCVIAGFHDAPDLDISLEEVGRPRVIEGSLRDLRNKATDIWLGRSKNEAVDVYQQLLSQWESLSRQTIDIYEQLASEGKLPERTDAYLEVGDHRTVYERAIAKGVDISEVISLQDLTVYATSLIKLMSICDLVFDRDKRMAIVSNFQGTHSNLQIVRGSYAFYFTRIV